MNFISLKVQRTSRLFSLICFVFLFHLTIVSEQEASEKLQYVAFDYDVEITKNDFVHDGFLQATLVESMKGYVPIFMTKTTNFADVFTQQKIINKARLEQIKNSNDTWFSNMYVIENFLRARNLLTDQLVDQYRLIARQYRAEKDKNPILFAQKKQDDIKKQFNKESEDTKKSGGGGDPEQDPENDPRTIFGFFTAAFTHIFQNKEGHFLLDTLENRTLLLHMAKDIKNYAGYTIEKTGIIKYWYGRVLPDGRQLWVWAKDGLIRDGGINKIPRPFDLQTGYCFNPFKK